MLQARVFRNLTRKCFSIQTRISGRWRTTNHASDVLLHDVRFVVSEKARQRVIRTQKKTVHAFVQGTLLDFKRIGTDNILFGDCLISDLKFKITYNPYVSGDFMMNNSSVKTARIVRLTQEGVFGWFAS